MDDLAKRHPDIISDLKLLYTLYFCPQLVHYESSGVTSTHSASHFKALTVTSSALTQFRTALMHPLMPAVEVRAICQTT